MEFLKSLLIIAGIAAGFKGIVKITFHKRFLRRRRHLFIGSPSASISTNSRQGLK